MSLLDAGPAIPAEEYPRRWERVQELLARLDLDLLVAYADDRAAFGPAHARWLANFPVHFEPACLLFPRGGAPSLLVGPESDHYARLVAAIPDVRVLREFTHPDEDYPYATIHDLAAVVAEKGWAAGSVRRVGLAGGGLIGADLLAGWRRALPGAEWVDVENPLCELRARKSPAELAVIRHAYRLAEAGLAAGLAAVAPGVPERAVAAEIEAAMRRGGAEGTGIDTIVASGPNAGPILARSTFRRIGRDDLVLLTVAPRYEGYHAAIGRPVPVGNPGGEVLHALDAACAAQQACANALRPGVEGRQVEAIGRDVVGRAGLGAHFLYSGLHSVGVAEFEPPIFGPGSPARLDAGMVISIDIPLFNAPWGGLRVEHGYLVTPAGADPLHDTPLRLEKRP